MKNREFVPKDYDSYDHIGKQALKKYLESKGYVVTIEPHGKYGIDIVAKNDDHEIYLDSEIRTCWEKGPFPFPTIHLPKRKYKFLKYEGRKVFFCAIRTDLVVAIFINGELLEKSEIVELKPKGSKEIEPFYNIKIEDKMYVRIKLK